MKYVYEYVRICIHLCMCIFHVHLCMRNERVQYNVSGCTITSAARNQIANVIVHLRLGRITFVRALASCRTANARNFAANFAHMPQGVIFRRGYQGTGAGCGVAAFTSCLLWDVGPAHRSEGAPAIIFMHSLGVNSWAPRKSTSLSRAHIRSHAARPNAKGGNQDSC